VVIYSVNQIRTMNSKIIFLAALLLVFSSPGTRSEAEIETEAEQGVEISKRSSDLDLELLLEALQKENGEATVRVGEREAYRDEEETEEKVYESRNDVFVEKRWRDVYADEPNQRDLRVMNSVTEAQAKAILDLHNKLRRQEGSANMEVLRYNPKLAALGQTWSQRCRFEHGQPSFSVGDIGHKDLGQNIYAHTDQKFTVEQAVQAWYDEKADYQYNSMSCNPGKVCGHYTAVTWAKTTHVGCGMTFCPSISGLTNAHFIVCNYAPAGNFQGEHPFQKGKPCTKCDSGKFFCNNNLCDTSCNSEGANCQCKAECQRCSKKTADCKCNCAPGSTGPDCSEQCADKDPKCGANPGYPAFLCTMADPNWAFVKDKCPKLCQKCKMSKSNRACRSNGDERRMTALKRAMLGYLENELKDDEE
jgi:hypothetical protein